MSHSYVDSAEILGLKLDIESMGYSVYVDWIEDGQLDRSNVTKENANVLRARMLRCDSLFFVTSESSKSSKWMPWELGFFDGIKQKVAILPVLDISQATNAYNGQEYLSLYPYVTKDKVQGTGRDELWVRESESTYIAFSEWLKGQKPFRRLG